MPDRIIRDELLESERWLSLKDNGDRLSYLALLLKADSLGNFTAEPFRLMRLWRDFGTSTTELVSKTLSELVDQDLIRLYQADEKPYLHIPRFGQRTRYIKRVFPPSPWTTDEHKQLLADNSPGDRQVRTGRAQQKGSEVKRSYTLAPFGAFDAFWAEYPRKKSKGQAMKAWKQVRAEQLEDVMRGLRIAIMSDDWRRENGRFIPHPATWLNARGWEDEAPAAADKFKFVV